jgi:hypothetical protein
MELLADRSLPREKGAAYEGRNYQDRMVEPHTYPCGGAGFAAAGPASSSSHSCNLD